MEKKNFGKLLFKEYGIGEWNEKSILLSNEEKIYILNSLKNGEYNMLVELIKLPYPRFVCEYIKLYRSSILSRKDSVKELDDYLLLFSDKSSDLGYRLYLMPTMLVRLIMNYIKYPNISASKVLKVNNHIFSYQDVFYYLKKPLEEFYKQLNVHDFNKAQLRKYIHIMSYIDANEAEKLGLETFTFKRFGEYHGFDLAEKMDALNPLIKYIVAESLGLYGEYKSVNDLEKELNVTSKGLLDLLSDSFYLSLSKSSGEFKNYVRLIDRKYEPDERREYASKSVFKKVSDKIETSFVSNYLKANGSEVNRTSEYLEYLSKEYCPQIGKEIPIECSVKHK